MTTTIKKINFYALLLTLLTLGATTASCDTSNDEPTDYLLFYDIATLESATNSGIVVSVQQEGSPQAATITFPNQLLTSEVKPGTRILIAYTTDSGQAYESGTGTLYGIGYVYNGVLSEGTSESTHLWATQEQNFGSIWRTGKWLNIQTECTYFKDKPTKYDLIVDSSTLDSEYPEVHIIYQADKSVDATTKEFYVSFDIESVWNLENVKGIKLVVVGNTGGQTYTFEKEQ